MIHFTVVQVVTTLVAFIAQFTRIFSATKPFWSRVPAAIQVWLPPVIPFVAALTSSLTGVTNWTDLAVALIVSTALLLPGAPSNRSDAPLQSSKRPSVPPLVGLALCFVLGLAMTGCSLFGLSGSFWPVVAHCAPSKQDLVLEVEAALLAGGDYEAALVDIAKREGAAIVECAVKAAVDELTGKISLSLAEAAASARGKAFLAKHGAIR